MYFSKSSFAKTGGIQQGAGSCSPDDQLTAKYVLRLYFTISGGVNELLIPQLAIPER